MNRLSIRSAQATHRLDVADGQSVRDALDATDWRVRAACGGTGTCGACSVRLIAGRANPPTVAEHMKLTPAQRAAGARLACQLRLQGDAEILLDQPAPPSQWKSIPAGNLATHSGRLPHLQGHRLGVAVDLGTTNIRVALWDRREGRRIATRQGPNPQCAFGADVLNRLDAACARPERATELARLARTAIVQAVRDILARDVGEVRSMLAEIGEVFIVGNTAMAALLTGRGADALLDPGCWQSRIDCAPADAPAWQAEWFMPHAAIVVPRTVAGFIGSDLVADLLATRLTEDSTRGLLLDIGTNTEIALWDGREVHATSVPGGPAFEGVGIRHGMPAEPGAICRVHPAGDGFVSETIGGGEARGFCGSGLADAIAVLLASGRLKPSGRFAAPVGAEGFVLDSGNHRTAIFGIDVDAFQRAKAATSAAMTELLLRSGMDWGDLGRLCVCGAFGRTLHLEHAQAIGLLPAIAPDRIELHADASLAGAEQGLLTAGGAQRFEELAAAIRPVNLSTAPGYDDRYVDHLRLRPIQQQAG